MRLLRAGQCSARRLNCGVRTLMRGLCDKFAGTTALIVSCFVLVLMTATANAGRSLSAVINELHLRGAIGDGMDFDLRAKKDPGENGRISRFSLELGNKRLKVPLQELQLLADPDLGRIEVTHRIPGFTGLIAKSIDPSANVRESINVTVPFGEVASCVNPSDPSDTFVVRSTFSMSYALTGELLDAGSWPTCQQCADFGARCEVDDEGADGSKGSN